MHVRWIQKKRRIVKCGDQVVLRLMDEVEVKATVAYVVQEKDDARVIVFKITEDVERLLEFREVQVDVIWWSYQGLKVSNSAILEENDLSYIERSKAGFFDKIYVKVLRQNDTYSIIENYTDEELEELGFDAETIKKRAKLSVYDEILLH